MFWSAGFVERVPLRVPGLPYATVGAAASVSVGVAAYEEGMGSYEVLLASADRALYAAKEGGRNRVEVAELTRGPKTVSYAARRPPVPEISAGGKGENIVVIDDDVPWEIAALFGCALLTGVGAIRNTVTVQPGDSVAVFGLGGVGERQPVRGGGGHRDGRLDRMPRRGQRRRRHQADAGAGEQPR